MQNLIGHDSEETAYIVEDYPYGFRLRCRMKCWIETKKGFGQRFVTRTSNPKVAFEKWNAPKASTYAPVVVMYLDDEGHVHQDGIGTWIDLERVEKFLVLHGEACMDEYRAGCVKVLLDWARREAEKAARRRADAAHN